MITVTWQTVITAAAFVGAVAALLKTYNRGYDMVRHQKEQDEAIKKLQEGQNKFAKDTQEELSLLTFGILSCLKGLKEQGADGPVTEAINKIEKHLNEKAHEAKA